MNGFEKRKLARSLAAKAKQEPSRFQWALRDKWLIERYEEVTAALGDPQRANSLSQGWFKVGLKRLTRKNFEVHIRFLEASLHEKEIDPSSGE